ncbi:MAG: ABC transporter permease [Anaerolineales bacterium]|nr:ABC transporter permease [Anaerolineales bacterium]
MFKLAWRNLLHERARLIISVGGVALAVMLILLMAGIFAGSEEHAVAYIKRQPADLWLMQDGVENLHMSSSLLPPQVVEDVRGIAGVYQAVGLLYSTGAVDLGETEVYSYIFAVEKGAPFGGPWDLMEGAGSPGIDEVILDSDLAARYGLGLGDTVDLLGKQLRIAGLSEGTFGIATSITFVNKQTLAGLMGVPPDAASYVLIRPESDADRVQVADRLKEAIPEANLMTREAFVASDQEMIRQMGADVIRAMNSVAYVVGLLVIALTVYTATVERAREYGVLKAIGADTALLMRVVAAQAFISSGFGFLVGIPLAYGIGALITTLLPEMLIVIEPDNLLGQVPVLLAITAAASLLPLGRIIRLDPMTVFKG